MQFNSYAFIFLLLPVMVLLYFLANRIRPVLGKLVLIGASVVFYAVGRPQMLLYLGVSMLINYLAALMIRRRQKKSGLILVIPIAVNVAALLYFKYWNFAVTNVGALVGSSFTLREILLPLGISFYTFQQIAYLVATSRGELNDQSLIDYLVYLLFFPKLVMGPITDPVEFIGQLNDGARKRFSAQKLAAGLQLFGFGLLKKVLLADTFARAASWVYGNLETATAMDCMLLILFYSFEIYFDFSGYSDMAVGVASMLHLDLPMNFDSPYKALSIRDFWKRWHISLTKFLTKYLYIPLGGSRKGKVLTYVNTIVVFLVSGLWHGANWTFVLWGLLHGLLSVLERMLGDRLEKVFQPLRWLCTMLIVGVLWLLFSADSVGQWFGILRHIGGMQNTAVSEGLLQIFALPESGFLFRTLHLEGLADRVRGFDMLLFTLAAGTICLLPENNYRRKDRQTVWSLLLSAAAFVWGVLCLGAESTFVYFGF